MHLDKPPLIAGKTILIKVIAMLLFLGASVFLFSRSIDRGDRYLDVRDRALKIEATVVSIKEDTDSEGSTEYDIYIGYTYEGKYYEHQHDTYHSYSSAKKQLGKKVTIYVDPEHPGRTLHSITSSCATYAIFGYTSLMIFLFLLCGPYRKTNVHAFGWNRATVEKDLPNIVRFGHRYQFMIIPAIVGMVIMTRFNDFTYKIFWVLNSAWLLIGLLVLRTRCRKLRLVKQGRYTFRKDVLINKEEKYDSEDGYTYVLTFSGADSTWTKNVSERVFNTMQKGHTVDAVYLEGAKSPLVKYDHGGEF